MSQLASEHTTSLITEERSILREKILGWFLGLRKGHFSARKCFETAQRRVHFEIIQAR
jgi:hypothetical protein